MIVEEEKGQYYAYGKHFDTPEELFKYSSEWRSFELDQQNAERILNNLRKEIVMSVFLQEKKFSNAEFSNYVEDVFIYAMKRLQQ